MRPARWPSLVLTSSVGAVVWSTVGSPPAPSSFARSSNALALTCSAASACRWASRSRFLASLAFVSRASRSACALSTLSLAAFAKAAAWL
eukprot:10782507-Alexandrium_andersonii.AAC.1